MICIQRWINCFLARSIWIVPILLYILIPLLLEKTTMPFWCVIMVSLFVFICVWIAKYGFYSRIEGKIMRYLIDLSTMAVGLVVLYSAELGVLGNTLVNNDGLYIACYLSSIPAGMSTKYLIDK